MMIASGWKEKDGCLHVFEEEAVVVVVIRSSSSIINNSSDVTTLKKNVFKHFLNVSKTEHSTYRVIWE